MTAEVSLLEGTAALSGPTDLPTAQRTAGKALTSYDKAALRKKYDQRKRLQRSDPLGESSESAGEPQSTILVSRGGGNACSEVGGDEAVKGPPVERTTHRADIPRHLWANIEKGLLTDRSARSRQAPTRLAEELHGNRQQRKGNLSKGKPHSISVNLPSKLQPKESSEIQPSVGFKPSQIQTGLSSIARPTKRHAEKEKLREQVAWYKAQMAAMGPQACDINC